MKDSAIAECGCRTALDDNEVDDESTSTDWRTKYIEVADMLAETRAELDDFHLASKELEAELENELQRTERAQEELKVKVARAESERDDWKSKFISLQTTHNTTTTSLQRELDTLRREHQDIKIQLRDLELGNDDLERNERAVSSSLADMEAKYSRALEEKILLEHELLEKASLEEESQRLRDELRDAMVEVSILKIQVENSRSQPISDVTLTQQSPCEDSLPGISPPDLPFDDFPTSAESLLTDGADVVTSETAKLLSPSTSPQSIAVNGTKVIRPSAIPSFQSPSTSSRTPARLPQAKRHPVPPPPIVATASSSSSTSKSKGVQMVSEMRARVRNLEQKIHTRVPRLRMGSITGKNASILTSSIVAESSGRISSSSSSSSKPSTAKTSWESFTQRRSGDSRRSVEGGVGVEPKDSPNSSGWVLILEDSPLPAKDKSREKRRISSPSRSSNFSRTVSSSSIPSPTSTSNKTDLFVRAVASPGLRRPQSRLSAGSLNTASSSSIPTPVSRPATPTYLPLHSGGLFAHGSHMGLKTSSVTSGPNKQASLGKSGAMDDSVITSSSRPTMNTPLSSSRYKYDSTASPLPTLPTTFMTKPQSKASTATTMFGQSRIGRPGRPGRRSVDNLNPALTTATSSLAG